MRAIRIGIAGTPSSIQGLRRWLDICRQPIVAKDSRLARLFVPSPEETTASIAAEIISLR